MVMPLGGFSEVVSEESPVFVRELGWCLDMVGVLLGFFQPGVTKLEQISPSIYTVAAL